MFSSRLSSVPVALTIGSINLTCRAYPLILAVLIGDRNTMNYLLVSYFLHMLDLGELCDSFTSAGPMKPLIVYVREGGGKKKDGWFSRKAGHSTSSPVFGIEVICERDLLPVCAGW